MTYKIIINDYESLISISRIRPQKLPQKRKKKVKPSQNRLNGENLTNHPSVIDNEINRYAMKIEYFRRDIIID